MGARHRTKWCDDLSVMVRCEAVRWVDDEPIPGIVEVVLNDAEGRAWSLIDKAVIFDAHNVLRRDADYPISILVACDVIERRTDSAGRDTAVIDLHWGVTDQIFEVPVESITQPE